LLKNNKLKQESAGLFSMPWNCKKRKLLTAKWLEDGITGKTGIIGAI
jgi:hypothetical protein